MANNIINLVIPGETINPKTGQRQFDFDQEKILLTNIVAAISNVSSSNSGNVSAAYAQANLALLVAEEAYSTANASGELALAANNLATIANTLSYEAILIAEEALASVGGNAAANLVAVYGNGTLVIPNANINFNNTSSVNALVTISSANGQANIAFDANGTFLVGPTAQTANTALFNSNLAYNQANVANALAAIAFILANDAANTVAVYKDGNLILANANLNFNTSATVNVSAVANGTVQTNVAFSANATALGIPAIEAALAATNAAVSNVYSTANAAANTVAVSNNGTLVLAAANLDFLRTATVNVSVDANGTSQTNVYYTANITAIAGPAFDHANAAYNVAQQANTTANLALPIAGGTITGNLTVMQDCFIDGDLIITGNLVIGANLTVGGVLNVATIIGLTSINQQ